MSHGFGPRIARSRTGLVSHDHGSHQKCIRRNEDDACASMLKPVTEPPQIKKEAEGKRSKTNLEVCLLNSHKIEIEISRVR
jgi:hypothetical protein